MSINASLNRSWLTDGTYVDLLDAGTEYDNMIMKLKNNPWYDQSLCEYESLESYHCEYFFEVQQQVVELMAPPAMERCQRLGSRVVNELFWFQPTFVLRALKCYAVQTIGYIYIYLDTYICKIGGFYMCHFTEAMLGRICRFANGALGQPHPIRNAVGSSKFRTVRLSEKSSIGMCGMCGIWWFKVLRACGFANTDE